MALKQKTKIEEELVEALEQARICSQKHIEKIKRLREQLKNCTHSRTQVFTWEWDSGYGEQRSREGLRCLLCGKERYYPGDPML